MMGAYNVGTLSDLLMASPFPLIGAVLLILLVIIVVVRQRRRI